MEISALYEEYLRCVQSVDDNVGRLMDYLQANGLDKNTIIIYTSDQGFYLVNMDGLISDLCMKNLSERH